MTEDDLFVQEEAREASEWYWDYTTARWVVLPQTPAADRHSDPTIDELEAK